MWNRGLLKNKIFAILVIIFGALTIPVIWDATFFLVALIFGVMLFVSKEEWSLR